MTIAFNAPSACIVISPAPQSVPDQRSMGYFFPEKKSKERGGGKGTWWWEREEDACCVCCDWLNVLGSGHFPSQEEITGNHHQEIVKEREREKEIKETIVFFEDEKRRLTHTHRSFSRFDLRLSFFVSRWERESQEDGNKNDDDDLREVATSKERSRQGQENWPCKSSHTQIEKKLFRRNNRCSLQWSQPLFWCLMISSSQSLSLVFTHQWLLHRFLHCPSSSLDYC